MTSYQGRALRSERMVRRPGPWGRLARAGALVLLVAALAHVPWGALRRGVAVVRDVKVEGQHYLDPARVCAIAGIRPGADLLRLDLDRARQRLMLYPRIARAQVNRMLPRGVRIRIVEREPLLLVQHGTPWEVDSAGVLLAPLAEGEVADVPLLTGPRFEGLAAGTEVRTPEVRRGLEWVRALSDEELQLAGQVSQIGVADPGATEIVLMNGTRVIAPPLPPGLRELSALRVVLADLEHRGVTAERVDLRFRNQVVVTPSKSDAAEKAADTHSG